jgi:hypothetical protein
MGIRRECVIAHWRPCGRYHIRGAARVVFFSPPQFDFSYVDLCNMITVCLLVYLSECRCVHLPLRACVRLLSIRVSPPVALPFLLFRLKGSCNDSLVPRTK